MSVPLLFLNFGKAISLPPVTVPENEQNGRSLTSLYRGLEKDYEIECSYSTCRSKCFFQNNELELVVFDRYSEELLFSQKEITEHYSKYLHRSIKQWRCQFNDFDIR